MRKKDYTKSFNFFEYEQQLNEEKSTDNQEIESLKKLATPDYSFSVIDEPATIAVQSEDDAFNTVFDVNAKDSSNAAIFFDAEEIENVNSFDEAIKSNKEEEEESVKVKEQEQDLLVDEPEKAPAEETVQPLIDNQISSEEQFEFAVETVTPIAEVPKQTVKVKKSFLKVFKKQKEGLQEEVTDEFFVEPVVSDIDEAQLTLDLNSTEENEENTELTEKATEQPIEESQQVSGQQFFAEAVFEDIETPEPAEENINNIPPVSDESDEFFVEPVEEQEMVEVQIEEDVTQDEFISEEEFTEEEREAENPYNFMLEDEPDQEHKYNQQDTVNKLISYEELKKTKLTQFETPYLFKGKKGEHIRFRITSPDEAPAKKARFIQIVKEYAILVASALIIGLFLNFFIFTFAHVNGSSMEPTLHNKQITLVSRLEYQFSEIERGDIVITRFPSEVYSDIYVKRVIALSNEKIEIKDGIVYVNGLALEEDYVMAPCIRDMELVSVPEGYVFVMGDNRNDSADSRIVGPIPKNKIIGKAKFIVFPTFENIED